MKYKRLRYQYFVFTIVMLTWQILLFVPNLYAQMADKNNIENHLKKITKTKQFRNWQNVAQLNEVATYIHDVFSQYADTVVYQEFTVENNGYKNVIASFGVENETRIVIGAHYDVCGDQAGADDNASGVVGLLELARMLKDKKLKYRIDLVAYSLEEPPFFMTENMGSYVHAKYLLDNKIAVKGMLGLEMIGYYSDRKKSQDYPVEGMEKMYGDVGNFLVLSCFENAKDFTKSVGQQLTTNAKDTLPMVVLESNNMDVHLSDHANYHALGFDACMITDTAMFRNKNYHQKTDNMETLDMQRVAIAIDYVYGSIMQYSK